MGTSSSDKYEFKAEIKKLLQILSKSLYQHKEIFLRELISNAYDALKRMHFISLQNKDIENPDLPLEINITINSNEKTITVSDSGLGMTKQELIDNLGTIASSGTEKFLQHIKESQDQKEKIDLDVIGQFGVGFYSTFMVAEKVKVISKSYIKGELAHQWESEGTGEFTIVPADRPNRGTDVIIYLKADESEYAMQYRVESIVKKYSNFISYPIFVTELKTEEKHVDKEKKKDKAKKEEKPAERKPINQLIPLWKKKANEIKEEEYGNFYHSITERYDNYSHVINYAVDGQVIFSSIYFIPEEQSKDLMHPDVEYGLTLYNKNVMIMQNCKELIPQWMRFVKGIVDSEDIPLNISRDTIQNNRVIMKINDLISKKLISELTTLAEKDPLKFKQIWNHFGIFLKEGIVTDPHHQDNLLKLVRFHSSKTKNAEVRSFDDYVKDMKKDQKEIYYLIGENLSTLKISAHLGYYNKNDLEVVFFTDALDNFLMMNVHEYKISVGEGEKAETKSYPFKPIDVSEESKKAPTTDKEKEIKEESEKSKEEIPAETKKFLDHVKTILGDKIIDVTVSTRLYDNAYRLANPADGMTSSMQRVMRYWTQTKGDKEFQIPKKILEFNANHPMIKELIALFNRDPNNNKIKPVVVQMFENCLVLEGDFPEPSTMVPRINQLLEMLLTGKDDVKNPIETQEEPKKEIEPSSDSQKTEPESPKKS